MKRDIRNLFKEEDLKKNPLPNNHRLEFLEKLKANSSIEVEPKNKFLVYKIAASVLLFVSIGYFISKPFNSESKIETSRLIEQIETVEQQYLKSIDKEWENFLMLSKDEKLIKRYKNRLDDLNQSYQEISEQYRNDANDFLVLETLVENLQTRLQLLKDIQKHIILLNQQNRNHENTTI